MGAEGITPGAFEWDCPACGTRVSSLIVGNRLIAAAPDLLAALEAVLPVAEVSYEGDPWFWDPKGDSEPTAYQRFEQARAAIAKATGTETTDG